MITSLTSAGATPDCSRAARMAVAPSFGVGTPVNWPRNEPMAVRLAPAMTTLTSDMGNSTGGLGHAGPDRQLENYRSRRQTAANRPGPLPNAAWTPFHC